MFLRKPFPGAGQIKLILIRLKELSVIHSIMPSPDERVLTILENVVALVQQMKSDKPDLPQNEIICLDEPVVVPIEMITPHEEVQLMKDKDGEPLADATKKAYCSRIKTMERWFPNEDLIEIIRNDVYKLLFTVKCRHDSLSTQRQCFSVISGTMKELDIPDKANIGSIIKENREDNDFQTSQKKKAALKTANIQENHDRVDMLKEKKAHFLEKMTAGEYNHTISREEVRKSKVGSPIYKIVDYAQMAALTQLYSYLDTTVQVY